MDLITNEKLEELLAASQAERVTKEVMESLINGTMFQRLRDTVTICQITLDNGYSVRGESVCVNPEYSNQQSGEKIAYDNAFRQLWPLFGFLFAEKKKILKAA